MSQIRVPGQDPVFSSRHFQAVQPAKLVNVLFMYTTYSLALPVLLQDALFDTGSGSYLHAGILLYLSSPLTLFNGSLTAQGNLMPGTFIHDVSTRQRRA